MIKSKDRKIIKILIKTEIITLCLKIMEKGSDLSKTVATFIIQRIILDENGLDYVCNTDKIFHAFNCVLGNLLYNNPSTRLLKHIISCYSRMSQNHRAKSILKENYPPIFNNLKFQQSLDDGLKKLLISFIKNLDQPNNINIYIKPKNIRLDKMDDNILNNE